MCDSKSHTDFAVGLYRVLLTEDMVRQYGNANEFRRDYAKLQRRVKNEGFSFLTKTLPVLAKAIDKALVTGSFTAPANFKKLTGTQTPAFLRVLLTRVFNSDGTVKIEPCISAVKDLRQILYLFYKYEVDYEDDCIKTFLESFKETDRSLGWNSPEFMSPDRDILHNARMLISALCNDIDIHAITPGHGPGAVATGEKNWEKMHFKRKYDCIHEVFPYYKFFVSHAADLAMNIPWYKGLVSVPSGIAKTVLVPKDSRGPRLISEEPLEFMFIQQGLARSLVQTIEQHPLTRGHVNFSDQSINGELARVGSISGDAVTLDMKEASDRVSLWLVKELFADQPELLKALLALRTEATELPTGEIHLLRKYAPMGSALCFPIESLVHWSLAVASLVVNGCALEKALKSIYVYGDDIIVKGENHVPLLTHFPNFGLKFNEGKCCTTGYFRESCGTDAILGEIVTIMKISSPLPNSPYDANAYASYLAYVNRLQDDAYYSSADYIRKFVLGLFGPVPVVNQYSSTPGFIYARWDVPKAMELPRKWNRVLQRWERKTKTLLPRKKQFEDEPTIQSGIPGRHYRDLHRSELQRKLLNQSLSPNRDRLEYLDPLGFEAGIYTVPRSVKLKLGWTAESSL